MRRDDEAVVGERNLASVAAWIGAYNTQDFAGLAEAATVGFRLDDPATGTHITGRDAFGEIARQVVQTYPDRRISVVRMIPLGVSAVAVQGVWDGTAAADAPSGAHRGDTVHHVESMVVDLVDGKVARMQVYR